MSLANYLEEELRPSKRCGHDQVWNPARQRCQDRFTGEPSVPESTYQDKSYGQIVFLQVLLELAKMGTAMLGTQELDRE